METDEVTVTLTKTHYEILCELVRIWISQTKDEEMERRTNLAILWGCGAGSLVIEELYSILSRNPDYKRVIELHQRLESS